MTDSSSKSRFMTRLQELISVSRPLPPQDLPFVRPAFEDTLAVVFAGWGEPVTQRVIGLYCTQEHAGDGLKATPSRLAAGAVDNAALIYGTAAHALDFDDVHQTSSTHPSAPIVAALVASAQEAPHRTGRMTTAFAVGLAVNVALGRVLGFPHYEKGWHATSTIGPLAAAAACAYLHDLSPGQTEAALALASAQAGGLQRNFGAMAKPVQAGLAGSAGLRAVRMAQAGITADRDVFADKGFFDLYGGSELPEDSDAIEFDLNGGGIAVKLYPCCYQTHRPIAAGMQAHDLLEARDMDLSTLADIEVNAPAGAYLPLRVLDPQTGSEGKFCGAYTVACALLDGQVGLAHFEDEAVHRPDVRELMKRIRLVERPGKVDGMKRRTDPLYLIARDQAGAESLKTTVGPAPGSPDAPPTSGQLRAKVEDCLAHYGRKTGRRADYQQFQSMIDGLLYERTPPVRAAAGD